MKRNMEKIIESRKYNVPSAYDLTLEELEKLEKMSQTKDGELVKLNVQEMIINSFVYGYELGVRASKHGHANKRRD